VYVKGGLNKIVNSADDVIFKQSSIDKAFTKHCADFGKYADGTFNTAFKLSDNQFKYLLESGDVK